MKRILLIILLTMVIVGVRLIGVTVAQEVNLPKVTLFIEKTIYNPGEPIKAVITLNNSGGQIITSKGFKSLPFHLFLNFYSPDNQLITSFLLKDSIGFDPPPPPQFTLNEQTVPGEPVEFIDGGWIWSVEIPNVHNFYALTKYGQYSVKAKIPMRTYSNSYEDPVSKENFAPIDSQNWQGALESNIVNFTLLSTTPATGTINVKAEKHTVGSGNRPASTKEPIIGLKVVAFDMSASCVAQHEPPYGITWQNYKDIWQACPQLPVNSGVTDNEGKVSLVLPPGDYILIAEYDPDSNPSTDNTIYIGVNAGGLDAGETMNKYLHVIAKSDGKKVPAKYSVVTGSQLLIIEPEYIEWDGTEELYPFVFESVGDWTVTTSVVPPEGFVADQKSLTTEVDTDLKAAQFVIMDVGSKWEHTKVEYRIKHKGKTETLRSQIGVKLSKRLAKEKGLGIFGQEDKRKKK